MVEACKHCLHGDKIHFSESECDSHFRVVVVTISLVTYYTEMGLYFTVS